MKKLLPLLMFLTFSGFRPVAVTTQSAKGINENFNSLASEIERRSLNQGGIVHQNLKISSSAHVTGDLVVDGSISIDELTLSTITATVGAVITVGCPTGFTKVTAQSRLLGCIQTTRNTAGTWNVARENCFDTYGGIVVRTQEYLIAINNYALTDECSEDEWLGDSSSGDVVTVTNYPTCGNSYTVAANTGSEPYRCWISGFSLILN